MSVILPHNKYQTQSGTLQKQSLCDSHRESSRAWVEMPFIFYSKEIFITKINDIMKRDTQTCLSRYLSPNCVREVFRSFQKALLGTRSYKILTVITLTTTHRTRFRQSQMAQLGTQREHSSPCELYNIQTNTIPVSYNTQHPKYQRPEPKSRPGPRLKSCHNRKL